MPTLAGKRCPKCGMEKSIEDFHKSSQRKDGLQFFCKQCQLIASSCSRAKNPKRYQDKSERWQKNNPDKVRSYALRRFYGLSLHDHTALMSLQKGRCAICSQPFTKTPHVDHSHETGQVRGLLCGKCNQAIGLFGDSIVSLEKAIQYLRKEQC